MVNKCRVANFVFRYLPRHFDRHCFCSSLGVDLGCDPGGEAAKSAGTLRPQFQGCHARSPHRFSIVGCIIPGIRRVSLVHIAVIVVLFSLAVLHCTGTAKIAFPLSWCSYAGFRTCPFSALQECFENLTSEDCITGLIRRDQVLLDSYIGRSWILNTLARTAIQSFAFLELNE